MSKERSGSEGGLGIDGPFLLCDGDGDDDYVNISDGCADSGQLRFRLVRFGLIEAQQDNIILRLVRSTDLVKFTPIFMSTEDFKFSIPEVEILLFEDTAPPAGGKAFYRLEAVRRPTTP